MSPSKHLTASYVPLENVWRRVAEAEPFEPAALEQLMHGFVASEGIKIGQIIHAVRVAVTGKTIGFGLFDILAILGRQSSLARIDRALGQL